MWEGVMLAAVQSSVCRVGRCSWLSRLRSREQGMLAGYISFSPSHPLSTDFPSVGVQPAGRVGLHPAVNPWDSFHSQVKECLPYRILNAIRLPIEAAVLLSAV